MFFGIEIVVIFGNVRQRIGEDLATTDADLLVSQTAFETLLASSQRLIDGLWAGGESSLKGCERKTNRAFARAGQLVGFTHFRLHVLRDGLVQASFDVGKLVVDGVGFAFGEQRCVVELDQFFFDHPPHQVGGIDLVCRIAPELAVETVGIQEGQE